MELGVTSRPMLPFHISGRLASTISSEERMAMAGVTTFTGKVMLHQEFIRALGWKAALQMKILKISDKKSKA